MAWCRWGLAHLQQTLRLHPRIHLVQHHQRHHLLLLLRLLVVVVLLLLVLLLLLLVLPEVLQPQLLTPGWSLLQLAQVLQVCGPQLTAPGGLLASLQLLQAAALGGWPSQVCAALLHAARPSAAAAHCEGSSPTLGCSYTWPASGLVSAAVCQMALLLHLAYELVGDRT
jgi:hypothetical protein